MSIDRQWDIYLERTGITPRAEIVPDHACQEFEQPPAGPVPAGGDLAAARDIVRRLLN